MSAGILFNAYAVYTSIGQPINPMCDVTIECDITPPPSPNEKYNFP